MELSQDLTPRQRGILPLLVLGNVTTVAKDVGVSRRTIEKWMHEPLFAAELAKAQDAVFRQSLQRIRSLTGKAIDVLHDLLESEDENIRARAVAMTLDHAAKLAETKEIIERLDALEARQYENENHASANQFEIQH